MRFFVLLLSLWTLTVHAASEATIQQLINQYLPDAHVGVFVQRADTGAVVVNIRGQQHFTPASTSKLFTAYAALKTLGPTFSFNTGVYLDPGLIQEGTYTGPVYLKFSGDPSFSSADLNAFVKAIKTAGVNRIDGPIILDAGTVPAPYYARGWAHEDLDWYYAAPISAAIIDENKINVQLTNSALLHQPIAGRVTSSPTLPVTSYLVSATQYESKHLCQFNASIDPENHITLYGCWPAAEGAFTLKMAIANPTKRVAQILAGQLKAQQIALTGTIQEGTTPASAVLLTTHTSEPLSALVVPVLRRSHNLYTETIAKQVGLHQFNQATFKAGASGIEKVCYSTLNLPAQSIELFDGSGLSNYSIATPQALAAVLKNGYADPMLRPIFMNALSHSGKSGTLGSRMASKDLIGRFVGKTGAMAHISNLAGYLFVTSGKSPLIVVVMINQTSMQKPALRAFENALMRHLMKG